MAAVLAGGPDTVLAGRSAAALWRMRNSARTVVDVISPRRVDLVGIEAHRITLPDDEVTIEREIPVTTPARTLFDLAAVVSRQDLKAAFDEAEVRRLTSPTSLDALLKRHPGRRGTTALRRILDEVGKSVPTSSLERRFLGLLDAHHLRRPEINRLSDYGELDATWPDQRLIVECDGFATHGTRTAFERDRAKDRELVVAGWRVIRITWRQLTDEPDTIARQLAALLG
jgi:very-short-patch-repair endonuclease